jgi:hypothetical protein
MQSCNNYVVLKNNRLENEDKIHHRKLFKGGGGQGSSTVKQSVRKRRGRMNKRSIKKIMWGKIRIK